MRKYLGLLLSRRFCAAVLVLKGRRERKLNANSLTCGAKSLHSKEIWRELLVSGERVWVQLPLVQEKFVR